MIQFENYTKIKKLDSQSVNHALRLARGRNRTQIDMAKAIDVSQRTYMRMENDDFDHTSREIALLQRISEHADAELSEEALCAAYGYINKAYLDALRYDGLNAFKADPPSAEHLYINTSDRQNEQSGTLEHLEKKTDNTSHDKSTQPPSKPELLELIDQVRQRMDISVLDKLQYLSYLSDMAVLCKDFTEKETAHVRRHIHQIYEEKTTVELIEKYAYLYCKENDVRISSIYWFMKQNDRNACLNLPDVSRELFFVLKDLVLSF